MKAREVESELSKKLLDETTPEELEKINREMSNETKKIVGYYYIGKPANSYAMGLAVWEKPKMIHRFFMRVLLGMYWHDYKDTVIAKNLNNE
jgi:hypothetical protein